MSSVRQLRGASTWRAYHFGPGEWSPSYLTSDGPTDPIAAGEGEVAARLYCGDLRVCAGWIVGPPDAVVARLETLGLCDLAAKIRAASAEVS